MYYYNFLMIVLICGMAFICCSESSTEPDPIDDPFADMTIIGEAVQQETKIEVYSENAPIVGYNKLYFRMSNAASKETINSGTIQIIPMMDMGTMKHSAPFENAIRREGNEGLFEGAINFIMSGLWEITIQFQNDNNDGEFTIECDVSPSSLVKSAFDPDSLKYFISLVEPVNPQVGLNDIEITLHCRENMMNFPAIIDVDIKMEPSMPSMGHGSPNNIDPVHEELGHYVGEVNFTMTGDWLVEFDFWKEDSLFHVEYEIYVP